MGRRKAELVDPLAGELPPPLEPVEFSEAAPEGGAVRAIVGDPDTWTQDAAEEAARLLATCPEVMLDGTGALVWVDDRARVPALVRLVEPAVVPDLLGRIGIVCRERKGRRSVPVSAPAVLCQTVVSRRSQAAGWRQFSGFARGPYVLGDGRIVSAQGYHAEQGLWLPHVGACSPLVPAGPPPDASEARALLDAILAEMAEFPWADPAMDPAVWLAYLLTLITRPAYPTAPLFLFDASRPRTGKDLLEKCAATIAYGQGSARVASQKDPDELRKILGALLREGATSIVIGDAKALGDPTLLQLITEQEYARLRILGLSESVPVPRVLVLSATGNNIRLAVPDLLPRVLHCRVESPLPRPELAVHGRDQGRLLADLAAQRPLYLGMAAAAVQGYLQRQDRAVPPGRSEGSFPGWAAIVRDTLLWCGYPDVTASRDRLAEGVGVASEDALRTLIAGWWRYARDQARTPAHLIGLATVDPSGVVDIHREAMSAALGQLLGADRERSPRTQAVALGDVLAGYVGGIYEPVEGVRVKLATDREHNQRVFVLRPAP